ncbi:MULTISPECIES: gluconate 2-dehydrogenase subunit 3 family protein [unclassified Streptomyces]|uniref:gluconate 2-dehydrogenase subunit 3 family protein n=1 Tax=unclassified Streptomyces TaxID=2593676 RepID=UPI002E298855|nr:gluconate 2-dehydrogenase subunit 3 family protein [Streptomyces sp. NBC_00223]
MSEPRPVLEPEARAALRAVVSRLIPADELGPGAVEAGADDYIVAALRGALASRADRYRAGLAAIDEESLRRTGHRFAELDPPRQDELLQRWGRSRPLADFVETVREHTVEGFLGDPVHGGNRDRIGWDLIGYTPPGRPFTAAQQGAQ